jgi:serine/threonine-protein kinase
VPKVVGKTATRATVQLEDAGFKVRTHGVESKEKPGTVVSQDPGAKTQADKGSAVDLGVSSGPGQQLVPDVSNLPRKQAIEALNNAGFTVAEDPLPSSTVAKGNAIRTSPPANKPIPKGTEVRLFISSGPPQVSVPDVVGLDKALASARIKDAGLNLTQELVDSDTVPKGRVVSETPSGGTTVDKGTTVALQISRGPQKVNVPDVTGLTTAEARAKLSGDGFKVKVVKEESATDPPDTVIHQTPGGGSSAVKGGVVTIFVAKAPAGTGNGPGTSTTPDGTPPPINPNPNG